MNRRTLLKTSLAAGALSPWPLASALAQGQPITPPGNDRKPNGFKRVALGDLELTILTDGYIRQSPVHPFLAPLAQPDQVKAALEAAFRPTDVIDVAMNVLVIESKDRLVLLDTGMGVFAGPTQGQLPKSLAEAGFKASEFTDVIVSHAHTDHIGGLVNQQNKLVFSRAAIHMAKAEYDFWQRATLADFRKSPAYQMPDFVKKTIADIQRVLGHLAPNLTFIDTSRELHGMFSFELAPGHTPGLTMTTIRSKNEKLVCIADLIHSDALLFAHPEWGFFGDTDIDQAVASRINMLQQLSASKNKTFAYHLPWPGLGHVRPKGTAFEWVPDVYSVP
ncbi:MBL fold metallo-hydrolase [Fibrella sp. HMF5335]|uniref:MBL fold metallo-hydrolase n=1 Tax=Fibrella rubiginis TaxID=2817060 RepID=A0A939GFX7_9BACT|nr:MBL fold metallo-hydrolase [Fibrella rubiginis]MBO0936060.1 MBL fold metallo-hydrolase [Fibrella rubiginis]